MTQLTEAQERAVESDEESREIIRDYVEHSLDCGRVPEALGFIAEYNTDGVRYYYDMVDAEIERIHPTELQRKGVREYVAQGGHDALSLALLSRPTFDNVSGRDLQRMIDTERERL